MVSMACIKPVTRNIFISPNTLNTNTIIIISELLTECIRCVFAPFPIEYARGLLCPIGLGLYKTSSHDSIPHILYIKTIWKRFPHY